MIKKKKNIIVYGTTCTYWNVVIDNDYYSKETELMRGETIYTECPHCGSLLFQISEFDWNILVSQYETKHPNYTEFVKWLKGKCFMNLIKAKEQLTNEVSRIINLLGSIKLEVSKQ